MRRSKAAKDEARRKNSLDPDINAEIVPEKVIPQKNNSQENRPTSFRLSVGLLEALKRFQASDGNVDCLNRTQIVERAISEFIGYNK